MTRQELFDWVQQQYGTVLCWRLPVTNWGFPAYHMNKEKWISVLLGREELDESIKDLLALSYELTAQKKRGKKVCFVLHATRGHIEEP